MAKPKTKKEQERQAAAEAAKMWWDRGERAKAVKIAKDADLPADMRPEGMAEHIAGMRR